MTLQSVVFEISSSHATQHRLLYQSKEKILEDLNTEFSGDDKSIKVTFGDAGLPMPYEKPNKKR